MPAGYEGVDIFNWERQGRSRDGVAQVDLKCGSHTLSGRARTVGTTELLIYLGSSSTACNWIDIVDIPLDRPGGGRASSGRSRPTTPATTSASSSETSRRPPAPAEKACASSASAARTAAPSTTRVLLYHIEEPGITIGHSAAWTWDGEILIFGHEPGGGVAPECEATDDPLSSTRTSSRPGRRMQGRLVDAPEAAVRDRELHAAQPQRRAAPKRALHARPRQLPVRHERRRLHRPRERAEIASSDPPPIVPTDLGGAWSSYWYNGLIYETNITEGLNIFELTGREIRSAAKLGHLNPQTQEFSSGEEALVNDWPTTSSGFSALARGRPSGRPLSS